MIFQGRVASNALLKQDLERPALMRHQKFPEDHEKKEGKKMLSVCLLFKNLTSYKVQPCYPVG